MATTIKLKNGSGAPLAGDLVAGEPALDLTNKRLYTEDSGGTVIEVGTNPSTIDINAGTIDGTVIGGSSAAAGTFTTFTSTGIDDNATSTAITIDSSERTFFNSATNRPVSVVSTDTNSFVSFEDANSASVGHVKIGSETDDMVFYANAQERMRIKSNNVGIGTTDPAEVLHVANTGTAGAVGLRAENSEGHVNFTTNGGGFQFETGASGVVTFIDSSGNVGIGTTSPDSLLHLRDPAGTASIFRLERSDTTVSTGNGIGLIQFEANETGLEGICATLRVEAGDNSGSGEFVFQNGLAGTITEKMRIDRNGNVGIGETSPNYRLHVKETPANGAYSSTTNMEPTTRFHSSESTTGSYTAIQLAANNGNSALGWWNIGTVSTSTNYDNHLVFQTRTGSSTYAERMRIDSLGNVNVGLSVGTGTGSTILLNNSGVKSGPALNIGGTDTAVTNDDVVGALTFVTADPSYTNTYSDGITGQISSITETGVGGGYGMAFYTGVTTGSDRAERMRIDSSGNLLVGDTSTPTSSAGNIVLYNGTAPTGNATNGVILYAEDVSASSELKVRDEAGNVTTLSPHNFDLIQEGPSEDMAWSYYSERDGKRINVDMLKAIRLLEQLSGEKLVHIS